MSLESPALTVAPDGLPPAAEGASAPLRLRDVSVRLGGALVLDRVDFDVPAGSWAAVIGPNGAGKTTLLRVALSLCGSESGDVELWGEPVEQLGDRERARLVAYVPQDPLVPEGATVTDYVLLGRNPHISFFGLESPADLAVVDDVLGQLGLDALASRPVGTLSGGERRRVVLARALAQEAPLLLLDEPTSELDLGHAQEVLDLVDGLRTARGITVVSAIHDLTLASQYAESLLLLDGGQVAARGTATEVLTAERLARHYKASVQILPAPAGSRGVVVCPTRAQRRR